MSENKIYQKVELRGYGEYYGQIIQADLIQIKTPNEITVKITTDKSPNGYLQDYSTVHGFPTTDNMNNMLSGQDYSDYQLNIDSLIFNKDLISEWEK